MKKPAVLLLVFVLCFCVFSGCSDKEQWVTHTYEDLTVSLPADFIDLSNADFATDLTFLYGLEPICVNGLREEKAAFAAHGLELTLQQYGELILLSNNVERLLQQRDGIWTFSYEAAGYTYVVTLWETEGAFWTVQAYCPTTDYGDVEDQMWKILCSVTV